MEREDRALIEEALAGRLESFDALMRRHEGLVYRVCLLYAGRKDEALDLTQEVFLKVWRSLGSFRGDSAFRTWLLRIAYNEGLTWIRTRGRRWGKEDLGVTPIDEIEARVPDSGAAPSQERRLMEHERRTILLEKIEELNPRQKTAVTLRYFKQMPLSEIATVLECSEGNVKNMLFRSVRKLRESLAGSGIEGWT